MRTKRFIYNSIYTAVLQVVTMLVGFVVPRVMLKSYGSEINGLVTSVNQFINYFTLVEAGLGSAAVYSLYNPLAQEDFSTVNSILAAARKFYIRAGYIFILLVIGLSLIYPIAKDSLVLSDLEIGILVLIIGSSSAINFFTLSKYRVLLTADQKVYIISIASIAAIVLNTLIITILASFKISVVIVMFAALFSASLRSLILWMYVKKKYKYINYNVSPNASALNKKWDAFYLQVLGSIQVGVPLILATFCTTLKEVSIYSIYNMVIFGISGLLSIFISGLSASFGDVIARKEIKVLQKSYSEFEVVYYMIITFAYSVTMVMIMPFIKLYTQGINDINYFIPILGFLFVLNGLLYNIKTPQGMMVISAGLFKETRLQTTIQGIIVVLGGIVCVQLWGLPGVLIGSILANVYRDIDLMIFIPKNLTKLSIKISLLRIIRIFVASIICVIPFFILDIKVNSYLEWFLIASISAIYSILVVVSLNIIFDREIIRNVCKRIINTIGRSN